MGKKRRARHTNEHRFSTEDLVRGFFDVALAGAGHYRRADLDDAVSRLGLLEPSLVNREAQGRALAAIGRAWNGGWQPTELARQFRRTTDSLTAGLALDAIAADNAQRAASTFHPRWAAQLTDLDLPAVRVTGPWLGDWARREEVSRPEQIRAVISLLRSLAGLGPLPILIPPPGAAPGRIPGAAGTPTSMRRPATPSSPGSARSSPRPNQPATRPKPRPSRPRPINS